MVSLFSVPSAISKVCAQSFFISMILTYVKSSSQSFQEAMLAPGSKVLGPTGDILIAPSANDLEEVEAPGLAPAAGESQNQVQGTFGVCCEIENLFGTASIPSTFQEKAALSMLFQFEANLVCLAADCLTEKGVFYGSDFLATVHKNATSSSDCCSQCKSAVDCTVWNW